jgi:hypothetical protein
MVEQIEFGIIISTLRTLVLRINLETIQCIQPSKQQGCLSIPNE